MCVAPLLANHLNNCRHTASCKGTWGHTGATRRCTGRHAGVRRGTQGH